MKATVRDAVSYTLELKVESVEEHEALRELCNYSEAISQQLASMAVINRPTLETMLNIIFNTIRDL